MNHDANATAAAWAAYLADRTDRNRNAVAERYMSQVDYHASRAHERMPRRMELADVRQMAVFGLLEAIGRFNPARGVKFESYAGPRIRGAITDAVRAADTVSRTTRERERRTGRPAPRTFSLSCQVTRYADGDSDSVDSDFFKFLSAPSPDVAGRTAELNDLADLATQGMTRAERMVVKLYYFEGFTMAEAGRVIGVSESRVSQMHKDMVPRMRSALGGGVETDTVAAVAA